MCRNLSNICLFPCNAEASGVWNTSMSTPYWTNIDHHLNVFIAMSSVLRCLKVDLQSHSYTCVSSRSE